MRTSKEHSLTRREIARHEPRSLEWVGLIALCHLASLNQSLGTKRSASKCQVAQLAALIGLFRIGGPSCFRTNHQTKAVQAAPTLAPGAISCHLPRWRLSGAATWPQTKFPLPICHLVLLERCWNFVLGYSTIKGSSLATRSEE